MIYYFNGSPISNLKRNGLEAEHFIIRVEIRNRRKSDGSSFWWRNLVRPTAVWWVLRSSRTCPAPLSGRSRRNVLSPPSFFKLFKFFLKIIFGKIQTARCVYLIGIDESALQVGVRPIFFVRTVQLAHGLAQNVSQGAHSAHTTCNFRFRLISFLFFSSKYDSH